MKKLNFFTLTRFPALIIAVLLMTASCARSPYNFVRVQPKSFDKAASVSHIPAPIMPASSLKSVDNLNGPAVNFEAPSIERKPAALIRKESNKAGHTKREVKKRRRETTGRVVERELRKSAAFSSLSEKKQRRVEKIITRKADRMAEKKAASPASDIAFNQWMKIGVILLLVGLVVGIAFASLGYLVAVIGVVFLVLGLIQQL